VGHVPFSSQETFAADLASGNNHKTGDHKNVYFQELGVITCYAKFLGQQLKPVAKFIK
jgi:hypothetical protein